MKLTTELNYHPHNFELIPLMQYLNALYWP